MEMVRKSSPMHGADKVADMGLHLTLMLRSSAWILFLCMALGVHAQHRAGFGAMALTNQLAGRKKQETGYASITNSIPSIGMAVHYAVAGGKRFHWHYSGSYVRRSFDGSWVSAGRAGGVRTEAHVDLDLLYIGMAPEVELDQRGRFALRMGLSVGFNVGGRMTGTRSSWGLGSGSENHVFVGAPVSDLKGDLRLFLSGGLQFPLTEKSGLFVEPFCSLQVSSLTKVGRTKGYDLGAVIGCYFRSIRAQG